MRVKTNWRNITGKSSFLELKLITAILSLTSSQKLNFSNKSVANSERKERLLRNTHSFSLVRSLACSRIILTICEYNCITENEEKTWTWESERENEQKQT